MNNKTLDLLLAADKSKFKRKTKEIEIPRLSEALGEEVIFTCNSLTATEYSYIQEEMEVDANGNISTNDMQVMSVVKSVKELSSKQLMEAFGAVTPKDLAEKLLLPGEISNIAGEVLELSGFRDDAIREVVTEVKN